MTFEVNAANAQPQKAYPASIQDLLDKSGKKDPSELDINNLKFSAESRNNPEKGMFSGLDADEIAVLTELNPELKEYYEQLADSKENKENWRKDVDEAADALVRATINYYSFLDEYNSASSAEKEQMQKNLTDFEDEMNKALLVLNGYSNNKISYKTLLQANAGKEYVPPKVV